MVAVLDLLLLVEPCEDSRRLLASGGEFLAPVLSLVWSPEVPAWRCCWRLWRTFVLSLAWALDSLGGAGLWGCSDCGPAPVCSGCPWPSG